MPLRHDCTILTNIPFDFQGLLSPELQARWPGAPRAESPEPTEEELYQAYLRQSGTAIEVDVPVERGAELHAEEEWADEGPDVQGQGRRDGRGAAADPWSARNARNGCGSGRRGPKVVSA